MAEKAKKKEESVQEKIRKLFAKTKGVLPGANSNNILEGVSEKIQEAIGRKLKK